MKVNWEKTEKNSGVLTVEVDEASVDRALDSAFQKVKNQVNVPGFRKGKVPRQLFEARFGVEALYQDAVDALLPENYSKAVDESGIEPVDQPEVDVEQIEKGKPFIFKATVTVKPEVELGEYNNLEVPDQDVTVTDEDVDKAIEETRERQAELEVTEGEAEKGDHLTMDFTGYIDGEPFDGGSAENQNLELGSGQFIPGFEDQLIGVKAGDEKEVVVTFPEDYQAEELAGKEATFQVKVNEVKQKHLPALDDEFAKDVSDFDTLDEYKADLRKQLEERKKEEAEQQKRDTVVEKAAENASVEIPNAMIEQEIDRMLQNLEQQLSMQGMNLDIYKQVSGVDDDGLREQAKSEAEKRVKNSLVLEAIAKAEDVEVTEADIEEELQKMSEQFNRPLEEIQKIFGTEGGSESLKDEIRIRKTVDLLVSNSQNVA